MNNPISINAIWSDGDSEEVFISKTFKEYCEEYDNEDKSGDKVFVLAYKGDWVYLVEKIGTSYYIRENCNGYYSDDTYMKDPFHLLFINGDHSHIIGISKNKKDQDE